MSSPPAAVEYLHRFLIPATSESCGGQNARGEYCGGREGEHAPRDSTPPRFWLGTVHATFVSFGGLLLQRGCSLELRVGVCLAVVSCTERGGSNPRLRRTFAHLHTCFLLPCFLCLLFFFWGGNFYKTAARFLFGPFRRGTQAGRVAGGFAVINGAFFTSVCVITTGMLTSTLEPRHRYKRTWEERRC